MQPIRVKLNEVVWRIRFVKSTAISKDADGTIDWPPGRHPTITIRDSLKGRKRLEVILHECIHGSLPLLDEQAVTDSARWISQALWKVGYRCPSSHQS